MPWAAQDSFILSRYDSTHAVDQSVSEMKGRDTATSMIRMGPTA